MATTVASVGPYVLIRRTPGARRAHCATRLGSAPSPPMITVCTEPGSRPCGGDEFVPERRGQVQHRDAGPRGRPAELIERFVHPVRAQHQSRSGTQRHEDLFHARIELQGGELQHTVVLVDAVAFHGRAA